MKNDKISPQARFPLKRSTLKRTFAGFIVGSLMFLGAGSPAQASFDFEQGQQQTKHHAPASGPSAEPANQIASAKLTEVKVPGTTMLGSAAVNLHTAGYTEKEYFASGEARRYDNTDSKSLETANLVDDGWAYNTRVIVRTPKNSKDFNGDLVIEWANVTIGQDAEFVFNEANETLLREGYAVAIASPQRVGVEHLKMWSPKRYKNLSVDVNGCGADSKSLCVGDPTAHDIFTQIANGVKKDTGRNGALAGLKVKNVIATGQSQSAIKLTGYYNQIQPIENFFDGFVYWDRATQLRSDVEAKAISVNSDALADGYPAVKTAENTRAWDVAGSTHGSYYGAQYIDKQFKRDKSLKNAAGKLISFTEWVSPSCAILPAFSKVDSGLVVGAAFHATTKWLNDGTPAPATKQFSRDSTGKTMRGPDGRVKGGIELAQFAVPTSHNATKNGNAFPCSVSGFHLDYSDAALKAKYGTHMNYVGQIKQVMGDARRAGYVLPADERNAVRDAERSRVAR